MLDFQERKRIRRVAYSWPMLVGLVVALGALTHAAWGVYGKYQDTSTNKALAEKDEATLRARAEALTANIARLSTERGKEEEIRTKYGFTKPGEGVIVIVDGASSTSTTSTKQSIWSLFWKAVGQLF